MDILTAFLIVIGVLFVILVVGDWIVHLWMMRDDGVDYGYAGYLRFKKEFEKVEEWEKVGVEKYGLNSLEYKTSNGFAFKDAVYANTIVFNYKGMAMRDPISFLLVKLYVRKFVKANFIIKKEKNNSKVKEWY